MNATGTLRTTHNYRDIKHSTHRRSVKWTSVTTFCNACSPPPPPPPPPHWLIWDSNYQTALPRQNCAYHNFPSWEKIHSIRRTRDLELSSSLCQAFVFTIFFQVKTENPQSSLPHTDLSFCLHEHIKPHLQKLLWLPVVSGIQYKVATLCYNFFTESYPVYLSELPTVYHPSRQLRSFLTPEPSTYLSQKQRPLDNELFLSRARHSGTHYRMMFVTQYQHFLSSKPQKLIS